MAEAKPRDPAAIAAVTTVEAKPVHAASTVAAVAPATDEEPPTVELTLKATVFAMSLIIGAAMALATFISYGPAAIRGALADVRGPLRCTYVNQTWISGSALCEGAPADSGCLRVIVWYPLDADGNEDVGTAATSSGVAGISEAPPPPPILPPHSAIAVLHPTFVGRAVANVTYCKRIRCPNNVVMEQMLAGHAESDLSAGLDKENHTVQCLIDQMQPGHAFYLRRDKHRLSVANMNFTRLEAISLLLVASLTLMAVAVALAVCCHRKLLSAQATVKEDVSSYVKIGDKYYAKASFKAKVAMVSVLSKTTRMMSKQPPSDQEPATASTSVEPIQLLAV